MSVCSVAGCGYENRSKQLAKGYCMAHYQQVLRHGKVESVGPVRARRSNPIAKECSECGAQFFEEAVSRQLTCSDVCSNERKRRRARERYTPKRTLLSLRCCAFCGDEFLPTTKANLFCGEVCRQNSIPERNRRGYLMRAYGLTQESYDAMWKAQGEVCGVCGTSVPTVWGWSVDHCHGGGHVRGILCNLCNTGIGMLGDDPARLRAAADYIERDASRQLRIA